MRTITIAGKNNVKRHYATEAASREPLGQFAHALDLTHTFIRSIDGTILLWATGAEQLYGFSRHEAVGKISHQLLQTAFPQPLKQIEQILLSSGEWEGELRHVHRDGREIVVASHWAIHDQGGSANKPLVIEVNNDITGLKQSQLERDLLLVELKRSNEELAAFSSTVSHDLRSPLNSIRNYTSLLKAHFAEQLGGSANDFMRFIVDGVNRMDALIDSLLAYAKVGAEQNATLVDLQNVIDIVVEHLRPEITKVGACVRCDSLPTLPGNPVEFVQIFQNLVSNAIKYRSRDEPPIVQVAARRSGHEWIVTISDNGSGIPSEHLQLIFEPLKRLHGNNIAGTGMGLAICQRIVTRNGGRIWAESSVGRGSTFYIAWPTG